MIRYVNTLITLKLKITIKPDFMTHAKTWNAIYTKVVFCNLFTFCSKSFNYRLMFTKQISSEIETNVSAYYDQTILSKSRLLIASSCYL